MVPPHRSASRPRVVPDIETSGGVFGNMLRPGLNSAGYTVEEVRYSSDQLPGAVETSAGRSAGKDPALAEGRRSPDDSLYDVSSASSDSEVGFVECDM